jgi:type IV secretory pathway VirB2 component (pilin)
MEMFWVVFYAILGLLAFIYPKEVHEAKSWLDSLDSLAFAIVVFQVFISALISNVTGITDPVVGLVRDSIEGLAYYLVYLIFANISRGLRFGRFSFERIISYIIALLLITLLILPSLP